MIREILDPLTTDLFHHLLQLAFENRNGVLAAAFAQGSDAIHERPPHEGELGAARKRPSHIGTGTDAYDDLTECGSVAAACDAGKYRMEGNEYLVKDGDVLLFRFNV